MCSLGGLVPAKTVELRSTGQMGTTAPAWFMPIWAFHFETNLTSSPFRPKLPSTTSESHTLLSLLPPDPARQSALSWPLTTSGAGRSSVSPRTHRK
jgi:hypothetical protein